MELHWKKDILWGKSASRKAAIEFRMKGRGHCNGLRGYVPARALEWSFELGIHSSVDFVVMREMETRTPRDELHPE
jgi:hypothetical protein